MRRLSVFSPLMVLLAPPLFMVASIIGTFNHLKVPIFSQAAFVFLGGLFVFGLAASAPAAVLHSVRKTHVIEVLAAGSFAGCVLLIVDVTWQGHKVIAALQLGPSASGKIIPSAVGAFFIWVLSWAIRKILPRVMFVGGIAMVMAGAIINLASLQPTAIMRPVNKPQSSKSPLLYVIFDEMMGVGGIDLKMEGGQEFYSKIHYVFGRHGFRLFERAYSRHNVTAKALPTVLNFDEWDNESYAFRSKYYRPGPKESLATNRLFGLLASEGRQIEVYQTAHLDFCSSGERLNCNTFPSFNPINNDVPGLVSKTRALFDLLEATYAESYVISKYVSALKPRIAQESDNKPVHFDVYAFPNWFGNFRSNVLANFANGQVFFGHFLMPHAPYAYDKACRLQDRWILPWFMSDRLGLSGEKLEVARKDFYKMYFEQAECALDALDQLLDILQKNPLYDQATVVVHGDHGSRLSSTMYAENMTERDMLDNYSTLYAIRAPGISTGNDQRSVSIQRLSAEYFSGKRAEELGPENDKVAIDLQEEGKVQSRAMPDFN